MVLQSSCKVKTKNSGDKCGELHGGILPEKLRLMNEEVLFLSNKKTFGKKEKEKSHRILGAKFVTLVQLVAGLSLLRRLLRLLLLLLPS
jgi:hypothetical protein